ETLSLSDLAFESNSSDDWDDHEYFFKEDEVLSVKRDSFEFSSGEFSISSSSPDNILFCGKLIPNRGAAAALAEKAVPGKKRDGLRSISLVTSRTSSSSSSMHNNRQQKSYKSSKSLPNNTEEGYATGRKANLDSQYDSPGRKSGIWRPQMKSSKRYLFAFGVGGYPAEMKLSDMKSRQRKGTSPARMFPSPDPVEHGIVRSSGSNMGNRVLGWRKSSNNK
ncbi:hypothetical protein Tsubulata_049256, partial [Turnera subulata]